MRKESNIAAARKRLHALLFKPAEPRVEKMIHGVLCVLLTDGAWTDASNVPKQKPRHRA